MTGVEDSILKILTEGGRDAVMTLGWLLFLLERYVFMPRREKEFREDVAEFRKDYSELAEKLSATLSNFSTILEVMKDRVGRSGK